jgi:pimeloyl-ACP methyl ester carboxylesterase
MAAVMTRHVSRPVDGFRLVYDRIGAGVPVILLHGWPGDRHDYREVAAQLAHCADVVTPDLRGFGQSDRHLDTDLSNYSAAGQAHSVLGLIDELGLHAPVLAGYDVGSRVAQALAQHHPQLIGGLVLCPPLPGVGRRILGADAQPEYWYQAFHQLPLVEQLLDGNLNAVRAYLQYFWQHWSAPGYHPEPSELDRLAGLYGEPGAMVASINYYRAGAGTVHQSLTETVPATQARVRPHTVVVWPGADRVVSRQWSDRLDDFFADLDLRVADEAGHFTPVEAPAVFAAAVRDALTH